MRASSASGDSRIDPAGQGRGPGRPRRSPPFISIEGLEGVGAHPPLRAGGLGVRARRRRRRGGSARSACGRGRSSRAEVLARVGRHSRQWSTPSRRSVKIRSSTSFSDRGEDPRPPGLRVELAGRGRQQRVPHALGLRSAAGSSARAGCSPGPRPALAPGRPPAAQGRRLPVGGRGDHEPVDRLQPPALRDELGRRASRAAPGARAASPRTPKSLGRRDDAPAEVVVPEPVDDDASPSPGCPPG